ncbi:hypothetical protein CRE_17629 [Caenorhabditis remanei]|uniref:DUF19 domain-containing protein n=1 Tax=Caenorhabditis remanei TaxID=31234 RepID=E3NJP7_CAERE|nr:hypothetical protein CRE_17629 [Caenorhabditis remanei]
MRKLAGFIVFLVVFNSFITEHVKAAESSGQSSRDVRSKWVEPMKTEENATPKTKDSEDNIGDTEEVKQYARTLRKKTIPEIEKDIASRNDRDKTFLTYSSRVKRQLKRKPVRKNLSSGPTLTADDVKEVQTTLENFLIKEYKTCQTKSAHEVDKCITKAQASTEKVLGYVPFALPVSLSLSKVTANNYGGHKIGFILAKHFDNCYVKNDKIDQFVKCFKSGNEKSPLNVARDKIAMLVGNFCKNDAKDKVECREKVVGYIEQLLDAAAANIVSIFCANKDKNLTCDNAKASIQDEVSKDFDIFSQYKAVPLSTFKTDKKYGEVDVGTEIGSAAEKCKNQQSIDKFVDCLKGELDSGVIRKAISAVLENYCGGNYKKEKAYQSCLTATGNKISAGSIVEANLKGCLEKSKGKMTDDFTSCLGSSQTDPLKTAMKEISNQLTNHCAKNQLKERICRKEGEEEVQGLIRNSIDSLILTFCEGESSKYKWQEDYDECQKTSKAKKLSGGEILKKEADSCKTANSKSRDEYLNCLKGKPLATVKVDVAQQLADSCGKVERPKVNDCRINGQTEVEKQLKDSLIAILMNFCREFNANPEDTYNECLNFDGDKLGDEAKREILQTGTNACNDKKTSNEYYKCLKGDDGAQTSPLKTAIEKVKMKFADVCGQKDSITDCRNGEPLSNIKNKLKEATEAIFLNYCGLKAKNNQQEYTTCVGDGFKETLPYLNDKTLPISLRNEISLSSLVTTKYGNIPVGEILEGQTGKCKNIKALDEVVSCLKASKDAEPSPLKSARDSTSDKFADYALEQNLVESDWNQGVEEMKKEFKQTIQAFLSNFCRENVNKNQDEYLSCLTEGLKLSESLSQGYTPIDIFLQCSSKKTEIEYNKCVDTVNGERLNAWTNTCSSSGLTLRKECRDSATKMASESAQVAKVAAKLVACVTPSCIKTERPKVIDEFVKADEKYCKMPCKDSKIKIEAAVKKGVPDCSTDKTSSKCRADLLSADNMSCDSFVKKLSADYESCDEACEAAKNVEDSGKPLPPQLQRSQYSHAPPPSITSTYIQSSQQMSQRVVVQPFRPVINQQNTNKIGVHSAVTNTKKNGDVTTQQQKPTSSQAPASPNSLARHRSANSGLRNSPFQTPALRTGNIFIPRTTPPSDPSSRPATPSGDVLMLRDQLENEKRKVMRLQTEFQKDAKKKEDEHQRNLAAKDLIIDKQKKDLEMFKSTIACRKTDIPTSSSFSAPSPILKTPKIPNTIRPMATSTPTLSSTSEIKKVYPKIPAAEPKVKTPRRRAPMTNFGHISAFRHPLKDDEEDDTFQMNASFEPSATSTPKMSGLVRTGLRRPLDLGDDGDENIRGAPTPKRKPVVFKEKRKKRTRKEVQEKIQKIWEGIDKDSTRLSTILNRKDVEKPVEKPPESMETEYIGFGEKYDWVDRILTKKMESVELRKTQPVQTERFLSARVRNRVMNEAEQRKTITKNCANCHLDVEISKPEETPKTEPGALSRMQSRNTESVDEEKKEEKIDDAAVQEEPPALKINSPFERMRERLKKIQDNLRLLRTHTNKCAEGHKKDLANNFTPMGPIFIPKEPEVPPPADIPPSNITLTNVTWKDGLNELWEVGSDVDDIELDQDFVLNPDSVTEDEDEPGERSGKSKSSTKSKSKNSKKSKKSKKSKESQKSHEDMKDGGMRTPKLDGASVPSTSGTGPSTSGTGPSTSGTGPSTSGTGLSTSGTGPSTSGFPSVSAPAPTAPTAEKPNASETNKKQNKSKSKSRESSAEPRESSAS